tara:strand:- start:573 stop:824 length:252 start_codon:yes stop_codon:yes gene_type:complete
MDTFTYLPAALPIVFSVVQCTSIAKYAADRAMASLALGVIIYVICYLCGPLIPWLLITPPLCVIGLGVLYQPAATFGTRLLQL